MRYDAGRLFPFPFSNSNSEIGSSHQTSKFKLLIYGPGNAMTRASFRSQHAHENNGKTSVYLILLLAAVEP